MGHPIGFFIFIIFTFAPFSSFDCWFFFFTVSASANVYGLDVSRDPRNLLGLVMNIWWFFLFDFKAQSERRNQFGKPKKKNKKRTPTKRTEQQQKGEPKKKKEKNEKKKRVPTNSKSPKERKMDGPFRCWSNKVRPTMIVPLIDATLWTRRGPFSAVKKHEKEEKKWAKKKRKRERERSWGIREEPNGKNNKTL